MLTLNRHELAHRIFYTINSLQGFECKSPIDLASEEHLNEVWILSNILPEFKVEDFDLKQVSDINADVEQWDIPGKGIYTRNAEAEQLVEHVTASIRTLAELFFSKEQVEPFIEAAAGNWNITFQLRILFILLSVMDVALYHRGMHKLIYKDNEIAVTTFDDPHKAMFRKEFP